MIWHYLHLDGKLQGMRDPAIELMLMRYIPSTNNQDGRVIVHDAEQAQILTASMTAPGTFVFADSKVQRSLTLPFQLPFFCLLQKGFVHNLQIHRRDRVSVYDFEILLWTHHRGGHCSKLWMPPPCQRPHRCHRDSMLAPNFQCPCDKCTSRIC